MSVVEDFIAIARKEVGYTETGINITKYNEWADNESFWFTKVQGLAWCATFVAWCINRLSEQYTLELEDFYLDDKCCWSDHWMANFKEKKQWYSEPSAGDLAFKNGHVGIVMSYDSFTDLVHTIEGNFNDGVRIVSRTPAEWLGFGRPNWILMLRFPTEDSEATSAKEFVINQGIYIGREDGEMHWTDNLTREEMAIVLYRLWKNFLKDR